MKKLRLFKDNKPMLGSDGIMHIDGRFNQNSVILAVKERNKRYEKNFPNLICDSFKYCDAKYNEISPLIFL